MNRFTGKVALVTGAASGIGRATALRLGNEGASLLLADINEEGLAKTAGLLAQGTKSRAVQLDVTDSANCRKAVDSCIERFGRLDILCNIAGIAICNNLTSITDEQWHRAMGINLDGVFFMCRAAMPHLIESKGNIVNMSSSAGLVGQAYNSAYCATKAGVLMFSKSLALEYSGQAVRVNAVCPGLVKTPLTANFAMPDGADMALMGRLAPLLEGAEPEEIAAAVAYLASDEARFVTGIALPIDGAQTAG
ncbi:MAG: SDR family oxidoreductase [Gammaproteobacteria bacterium]|jgi:meso-butanediol dehydrogenase/(S,S)-butanediol dehydrogenase/diacetyl reductase|nr:SDR family oxidoreductase [Gammaproteobacteria bacterium]MBK6581795.1 SDR family oxidoreductase [Gammaproteobacteria bacterium]MBK7520632.1 SDR family oxidoreductase [Gammaproteobacteria bacterium]MBK9664490.1 SDR family oxidoreductase [Gammaproteobacteria bacterium]